VRAAALERGRRAGDFFWTFPADDASLLLVVGKGLKEAMTVATLAGALRNESCREPFALRSSRGQREHLLLRSTALRQICEHAVE
jgi:hypothetical protein